MNSSKVVRTQISIALRCTYCGRVALLPVSVFTLGGGKREYNCPCGQHILTVSRKGGDVWLQLSCFLCEGIHLFKFSSREFWSRTTKSILCPETETEVGYVGPTWALAQIGELAGGLAEQMSSLFKKPEVGVLVFKHIVNLTIRGKVRCACGTPRPDIEPHPSGVEVFCGNCGAAVLIPAENAQDYVAVRSVRTLRLGASSEASRKEGRAPDGPDPRARATRAGKGTKTGAAVKNRRRKDKVEE